MIYFLRHLKTDNNKEKRITGKSDVNICNINVDKIDIFKLADIAYVSPLRRCIQTMGAVAVIPHMIIDDRLEERGMGSLEGMYKMEAAHSYPQLFTKINDKYHFHFFDTPPDGEDFETFYSRIKGFYEDTCLMENKDLLICSHNQTLKLLYFLINNKEITMEDWTRLQFEQGKIIKVS